MLRAEGRDLGIMKSCEILSTSEKLRKIMNMLHFLEVIPRIYRIFIGSQNSYTILKFWKLSKGIRKFLETSSPGVGIFGDVLVF